MFSGSEFVCTANHGVPSCKRTTGWPGLPGSDARVTPRCAACIQAARGAPQCPSCIVPQRVVHLGQACGSAPAGCHWRRPTRQRPRTLRQDETDPEAHPSQETNTTEDPSVSTLTCAMWAST